MSYIDQLLAGGAAPQRPRIAPSLPRTAPQTGAGGVGAVRANIEAQRDARAATAARRAPATGGSFIEGLLGQTPQAQQPPQPGGWKGLVGELAGTPVGKAAMKAIEVVDLPRAATVGLYKELERGGLANLDWGNVLEDTKAHTGFGQVIEEDMADAPHWLKVALGFTGDLVLDPTNYISFGTMGAAKTALKETGELALKEGAEAVGRGAISETMRQGSRIGLAQQVSHIADAKGLTGEALEQANRLAREAGKRGRGAFTEQGLKRAGVTPEFVAKELGQDVQFGGRLRLFGAGVDLPGTKGIAEGAENLKGSVKAWAGGTEVAERVRNLVRPLEMNERAAINAVLKGNADTADKARYLGKVRNGRAVAQRWLGERTNKLARDFGKDLRKLSHDDLVTLTHALENGDTEALSGLGGRWAKVYEELGNELQGRGVDFRWRGNYSPHILTNKFKKHLRSDQVLRKAMAIDDPLGDESLQFARALEPGVEFMGHKLEKATIQELNDISQKVVGFKAFEDDASRVMEAYLREASSLVQRDEIQKGFVQARLVKPKAAAVDEAAFDADIADAEDQLRRTEQLMADEYQSANKARIEQANLGVETAQRAKATAMDQLNAARTKLDDAVRRQEQLLDNLEKAGNDLNAARAKEAEWEKIVRTQRSTKKAHATRRLAEARDARAKAQQELYDAKWQLQDFPGSDLAKSLVRQAEDEVNATSKQLLDAIGTRKQMDLEAPKVRGSAPLAAVQDKVERVRNVFTDLKDETQVAASTVPFLRMDTETVSGVLTKQMQDFDDAVEIAAKRPSARRDADPLVMRAIRDDLRNRTDAIRSLLRGTDDPNVEFMARLEAQAIVHDMKAWRFSTGAKEIRQDIATVRSEKFKRYAIQVLDDGFRDLESMPGFQISSMADDMLKVKRRIREPGFMRDVANGMDKFMNWWKSYATGSPGFIIRNVYSGLYSMMLDGVNPASIPRFARFYTQWRRDPAQALEWATKTFGAREAKRLDDAMTAVSGSGWGLVHSEIRSHLTDAKVRPIDFAKVGSTQWGPIRVVRDLQETAEAMMRGTHAYDVLRRGGTVDDATRRVEMWHFNYRDISDFDRAAKRVIPFWSFYSRNLALQTQVWSRFPQRLNKTYFNLARNMELQAGDQPEGTPGYYAESGWVPFGPGKFFAPDLPSLRFLNDVNNFGDPKRILSDAAPYIKGPAELISDTQLFSDVPFRDNYTEYGSQGPAPRTPTWAQIPGVSDVLNMLPGTERTAGGELAVTDRFQNFAETLAPGLSRMSRLFPDQPKYEQRRGASWLGFLGAPYKQVTEDQRRGELMQRQRILENELRRRQELGYVSA